MILCSNILIITTTDSYDEAPGRTLTWSIIIPVMKFSEGYPNFEKGEDILVFLSRDDSDITVANEDYYVLTGMLQGKYNLKEKNTEKKIFKGVRDEIDPLTFNNEISNELEKFKSKPKMKDAKLFQP